MVRQRNCRPKQSGNLPAAAELDGAVYAWGDEFEPGGKSHGEHLARTLSLFESLKRWL